MDDLSDLAFFSLLAKRGSMVATAQELGITPPAVSKRLAALERRLGVRLLHRTTRSISLTTEGQVYLIQGRRILEDLDALERSVAGSQARPKGLLRIAATFGFGRRHIAPALAVFASQYPEVEVQLHLTERPVNLVEEGFDAMIRFGELPDVRLVARLLAYNRRVLCATPAYLRKMGRPATPRDLAAHHCIFIRESNETFGTWHLSNGARQEATKVSGPLSTNDGEVALAWALADHGILMRSLWELGRPLRAGRLELVLPDWRLPPADISVVFPTRSDLSAKTRALVDFLLNRFKDHRADGEAMYSGW